MAAKAEHPDVRVDRLLAEMEFLRAEMTRSEAAHREAVKETVRLNEKYETCILQVTSYGEDPPARDEYFRRSIHDACVKPGESCPPCLEENKGCTLMNHLAINKVKRSLWVYRGLPWVMARRDYPAYGNIYLPVNSNRPKRWDETFTGDHLVRVLRPAVFYRKLDNRPGLIESGERRPAVKGEWIEVDGLPVKVNMNTENFPWPILIEIDSETSQSLSRALSQVELPG